MLFFGDNYKYNLNPFKVTILNMGYFKYYVN